MVATDAPNAPDLTKRFDPFHEPYLTDPYPIFAEARAATPILYSPELGYWIVTRYEDIHKILPNTKQYSVSEALSVVRPLCPAGIDLFTEAQFDVIPTLANNDPPWHSRIRRLANLALSSRRLTEMEIYARELTVRLLVERFTNGQTDLLRSLTWDVPALVILRLLGIPEEDVPLIKPTLDNRILPFWGRASEDEQLRVAQWMIASWKYTKEYVARRAQELHDDFTSDLLQVRSSDPPLTQNEVTSIIFGLLVAAHETTTSLLTNGLRRLLAERHAWEEICRNPALIPNAIEEVLRIDTSIVSWRRKTIEPVQIGGIQVPADATLLLLLGSANRDPGVFEDPETFDIHRRNAKEHLSFGLGNHFCLGAPLARLEARVVFEELSSRIPTLRLVPEQQFRFLPNTFFRAPTALLVEWDV
jgi:cytochrome P450